MSKATRMLKASASTKWTKKRLKKLDRFPCGYPTVRMFIRIKRVHFKKGWHPKIPGWPNYDKTRIKRITGCIFYTNS